MAAQARNPTEIEADRLFILKLRREGGQRMKSIVQVARVLNERRAAAAKEFSLVMGRSPEEADADGQAARLSVQTVRRDLRVVDERIRKGADAAAAAWLDEQIDATQHDIERTYVIDEQVAEDLERSRSEVVTSTRGVPGENDEGEVILVTKDVTTRRRANGPARAELYQILVRNVELRMKLRAEMRTLRYGQAWFANRVEEATFSQTIVDLHDPDKARDAAVALYRREVEALVRSEKMEIGPMPAEILAAERHRVQRLATRVGAVKALISAGKPDLPPNAPGSGQRGSYELIVTRVSPGNGRRGSER